MISPTLRAQINFCNGITTGKIHMLLQNAGFIMGRFEFKEVESINGKRIHFLCLDMDPMSETKGQDFTVWIEYDGAVRSIDFLQNQNEY